jgi:hypothetical protein
MLVDKACVRLVAMGMTAQQMLLCCWSTNVLVKGFCRESAERRWRADSNFVSVCVSHAHWMVLQHSLRGALGMWRMHCTYLWPA